MGQKVNPIGLRLGINQNWRSRWYAPKKEYWKLLNEDFKVRDFVKEKLFYSGVAKIEIERVSNRLRLIIHTARPGLVIGRKGTEIDKLKEELAALTSSEIMVDIVEIKQPEIEAQLVAENIALQLVRRVSFRRAMKRAVQSAMTSGAKGVKISCSGRLGGAEIARREVYKEGSIPLHTLRAFIDYGFAEAKTTYGLIGVKVWIFRGVEFSKAPLTRTVETQIENPKKDKAEKKEKKEKKEKAQEVETGEKAKKEESSNAVDAQ